MNNEDILWFEHEGKQWTDALPLGNGRMGALVYGRALHEKIQLDESTFWSGSASVDNNLPDTWKWTQKIRNSLLKREFRNVNKMGNHFVGRKENYGTNLPIANLFVDVKGVEDAVVKDFSRSLNIKNAVSEVRFQLGNTVLQRKVFVSNPAQVLVISQMQKGEIKPLSAEIWISKIGAPVSISEQDGSDYTMQGDAWESLHSDGHTGAHLEGRIRIVTDGKVTISDKIIHITDAVNWTMILAMETTMFKKKPAEYCRQLIENAGAKGLSALIEEHQRDVSQLYDRVHLSISSDSGETNLSTERRLKCVQDGDEDLELTAQLFRYGRYLLIASSRENSPLPTHLGGIWNDNIYCNMDCTEDMHLDMNIEMQYWLSAQCGLNECYAPLFNWVVDTMIKNGERTAWNDYHAKGFVAHVVSNPWGYTALGWSYNWGVWAMGGVWTATLFWDCYQYNDDLLFLAETAYPIIQKAADFASDYLFWDSNRKCYLTGPSFSPENHYNTDGITATLGIGNTCDVLLVREILDIAIKAAKILNEASLISSIEDHTEIWREKYSHLLPYQISMSGRIQEWIEDFDEPDPSHRHTSHLLGMYPFWQITKERTPELAEAVERSLEERYRNYEITSWGMNMFLGYYARLHNTEKCNELLLRVERELARPSMMIVMGDQKELWQGTWEYDGNTGFTSAIVEMLVQSHDDEVYILPALPKSWRNGSLTGICLHHGRTADIVWKEGKLTHSCIHAVKEGRVILHYENKIREISIEKDGEKNLDSSFWGI